MPILIDGLVQLYFFATLPSTSLINYGNVTLRVRVKAMWGSIAHKVMDAVAV